MAVEYLNGSISILDTSNARGPPVKNILLKTTLWYRHWREVCIITYWFTAASRCDHQLPATGNCWRRPTLNRGQQHLSSSRPLGQRSVQPSSDILSNFFKYKIRGFFTIILDCYIKHWFLFA